MTGCVRALAGGLLALLSVSVSHVTSQTRAPGDPNYCQWEDFTADCPPGEVVVVQTAKYGRMDRGRCVKRNYGYLGCAMNVLPFVDARCSGRRSCSFSVYDDNLRKYKPCPEDISSYLEAQFTCLKVSAGSKDACQRHRKLRTTGPLGYIASIDTVENGYGSTMCPWRIEVNKGQRVNLTLYNFARGRHVSADDENGGAGAGSSGTSGGSGRTDVCYELAEIRENGSKRRMTLCDGLERHTSVYVSRGNVIDVQLVSGGTLETLGYFLLKYEAIGCPDLKVAGGSWIKREGDEAVVRCNQTGQTRYLTCKGTQWIGEVGNCTTDSGGIITGVFTDDGIFPYGILIVVAIGVALGIFFGGLLLSVVVVYMKRRQRNPETAREMDETSGGGEKLYMRYEVDVDGKSYPRAPLHGDTIVHPSSGGGGVLHSLKGPTPAPQLQLPPPGVSCGDTLHLHHHHVHHAPVAGSDSSEKSAPGGKQAGVPSYSRGGGGGNGGVAGGTLTRPGSGQYNRPHIYESPTFT